MELLRKRASVANSHVSMKQKSNRLAGYQDQIKAIQQERTKLDATKEDAKRQALEVYKMALVTAET